MTALADALVAAQARTVAALAKQYVRNGMERSAVVATLDAVGLTDKVDQEQWLAALDAIREHGATVPTEAKPSSNGGEQATDAQWKLIRRLCDEKAVTHPDGPLTKEQAHEVIDSLKAGSYDPDKWGVPF